MPYKSSKRPTCVGCGKLLIHPKSKRCKPCSNIARIGVPVQRSFTPNDYRIDGDSAYLLLVDKHGNPKAEAIIDTEDLPIALQFRWALNDHGYVSCSRVVGGRNRHYLLLASPCCDARRSWRPGRY